MTLLIKLDLDMVPADLHVKFLVCMSNGSVVRVQIDTHTCGSDSMTSTADAGGNYPFWSIIVHLLYYNKYEKRQSQASADTVKCFRLTPPRFLCGFCNGGFWSWRATLKKQNFKIWNGNLGNLANMDFEDGARQLRTPLSDMIMSSTFCQYAAQSVRGWVRGRVACL